MIGGGGTGDRTDQESRNEGAESGVDSCCWTDKDAEHTVREGTMSAKNSEVFTKEERAAMRERAKELKAEAREQEEG